MKLSILTSAFLVIGIWHVPANAEPKGAACLEQCRTDLKQRGLWNAYPYGHCRNKCGYWQGADKDPVRPKKKEDGTAGEAGVKDGPRVAALPRRNVPPPCSSRG